MATFRSNLAKKRTLHRGIYDGQDYSVTGVIKLPAGTVLTAADALHFVPVGENAVIHKIAITGLGSDLATADFFCGRFQMFGPDGVTPLQVERIGPSGESDTKFASPADDPDRYIAVAAVAAGYVEAEPAVIELTPGPTMVGLSVDTGDTITSDCEIRLTVYIRGENSGNEVQGEDQDPAYLLD